MLLSKGAQKSWIYWFTPLTPNRHFYTEMPLPFAAKALPTFAKHLNFSSVCAMISVALLKGVPYVYSNLPSLR